MSYKAVVCGAFFAVSLLVPLTAHAARTPSEVWAQPLTRVAAALENEPDVNAKYPSGMTPLMYAARHNNSDVLTLLLRHRADPLIRDDGGMTPLMYAARYNSDPAVISALSCGGSLRDAQDENGKSALILAAQKTHNDAVVVALLECGSDPTLKDKDGRDALFYARANVNINSTPVLKRLERSTRGGAMPSPPAPGPLDKTPLDDGQTEIKPDPKEDPSSGAVANGGTTEGAAAIGNPDFTSSVLAGFTNKIASLFTGGIGGWLGELIAIVVVSLFGFCWRRLLKRKNTN